MLGALAPRVVAYLIVAQFAAFFLGWIATTAMGMAGVSLFATTWDRLAILRSEQQVIASLVPDGGGNISIVPSRELAEEMRRAPRMRFAVFSAKRAAPGSDPELVSFMTPLVGLKSVHSFFALPEDDASAPEGYMEPMQTKFGLVTVAVHGQKFRWDDLIQAGLYWAERSGVYLAMAIVLSATTAWVAVRSGLAPLRQVAREASQIDMARLGTRLPSDVVPSEAMPLVRAINQALERLDVGARRQRLFIANAAHELRTPVALLGARLDAPREANFENQLKHDVWRISHIIQQLLAERRAEEQTLPLDEVIDFAEVAQCVADDTALLAVRNGRHIEYVGPSSGILVSGNKGAVEAILANLIDNALRAEPEGGTVRIHVELDTTIAVIDHGSGVPIEDRQMIFEPFWRRSDDASGAGLGLAIAKELVNKLRGNIWIEETPGGGSTFKLSFPGSAQAAANMELGG